MKTSSAEPIALPLPLTPSLESAEPLEPALSIPSVDVRTSDTHVRQSLSTFYSHNPLGYHISPTPPSHWTELSFQMIFLHHLLHLSLSRKVHLLLLPLLR